MTIFVLFELVLTFHDAGCRVRRVTSGWHGGSTFDWDDSIRPRPLALVLSVDLLLITGGAADGHRVGYVTYFVLTKCPGYLHVPI